MKIGLIRHFAVKKPYLGGLVRQSQVIQWFNEYDISFDLEIVPVEHENNWEKCYSSLLPRAILTASALCGEDFQPRAAFNEPSIAPIFSKDIRLPFLLWGFIFRLAILTNHKSQSDTKEILEKRVKSELDSIFSTGSSSVLIVSHAFIMTIISKLLLDKGFEGKKIGRAQHNKIYRYERLNP